MNSMLNKVELIGRLGADPEQRTTPNGHQYARFSIPLFQGWGNQSRKTSWVTCEAWNKIGEIVMNKGGKGKLVRVEGELVIDNWEANGERRSRTYIRVRNVIFLTEAAPAPAQNQSNQPTQSAADEAYMNFNEPQEPEMPAFLDQPEDAPAPDGNTLEELFGQGFDFNDDDKNN